MILGKNKTVNQQVDPDVQVNSILAACRDNEYAYETDFDGERHGALTYWLLRSLEKFGTGVIAKTLHNHIFGKVHTQFEKQTPMLQGESDRSFFGNNFADSDLTVSVIQVDLENKRVQLNAGQAQGLRKGAEFAIYPGTADLTQTDQRLALVEITRLGGGNCWATITEMLGENKIEDIDSSACALLLHPNVQLVRKVRLLLKSLIDISENAICKTLILVKTLHVTSLHSFPTDV